MSDQFRTRDVSLAAFARFKGYDLVGYQTIERGSSRDGEWVFNISSDESDQLKVEYVNSDISAFEGIRRGMSKQKYG